jgi:hypothetical protein
MEIHFCYSLIVTKTTDEYLTLTHKEHGVMEGCFRLYNFERVFRRYICYENHYSRKLLENPKWSASFNHDEKEICIHNDLNSISLTKEICFDEDWDDYEDTQPTMEILYQGDFYSAKDFCEMVNSHDLEFIYDDCKITSVYAELEKVEVDHYEVDPFKLLREL